LEFTTGNRAQEASPTWYRGEHCNYNPTQANMRAPNAVEEYILHGWIPDQPFISPGTKITAFGSCFARNISDYLNARHYSILTKTDADAYVVKMGEGIVNTYALRGQFEWAFRGTSPTQELWHGYKAEAFGYDEKVRQTTLEIFNQTEVFILTLGLSEVWYDEPTGEVFWRAVPMSVFDSSRHKFRVTSVAENIENLRATYALIREFTPEAKIVVTLSPIPLVATFRPVSTITANSASKAILRAAIDEVYREFADDGHLHYWPSYEIVMDTFGPGKWKDDRRHLKDEILDYIMGLFETYYCIGSKPERSPEELRALASAAAGDLSPKALAAAGDPGTLERMARRARRNDDPELADLLTAYARATVSSETS
jgi:hypothetical protein